VNPSPRFRSHALVLALTALLSPAPAWANITPFPLILTSQAGASFDGSLANPAVAGAYLGVASPDKLAAALAGLRPLLAELPLILPPGPCWFCGFSVSSWRNFSPDGHPAAPGFHVFFGSPDLLIAGADADLGAAGAPVTLAFARLLLTASFETGRDFIIGHPAFAPEYSPNGPRFQLIEGMEPPPVGGPGWIDSNGHDLKINGVLSSHQKLWKEGEGSLWLTGANVWHAVPEVMAGVLKGDTASLATDIVNQGRVSFAQAADGAYAHVISGAGGVEKIGAGVLTLSRAQTYTGPTRVLEGSLALAGGSIESSAAVEVASGAMLDASRAPSSTLRNLSGDGRIRYGDERLTLLNDADSDFAGQIDGHGELLVTGSRTLALTGANTHRGGTRVASGRLAVNADTSLGAAGAPVTIDDGGRLILLADLATARTLRAGHGASVLDTAGHDLRLLSPLEGHGQMLTKQGAGALFLAAASSYAGAVSVTEGALALVGAGALNPASHVVIEAGVLDIGGADGDRRLRSIFGHDGAEIRLGANSLTLAGGWGRFDGVISGQGGLILDDAHSFQTLTGANTYAGPTTVLAGTLRARPRSLSDRVVNHGRLELFDHGGLNDISAYSGDISGSGQLVKTDKSVIWLRGHNDHSGGTRIEAGVLMGNTDSLPGDIETHAGLAFYQVADGAYAGRVRGTGTLMSFGPATLTLDGESTHTGGTAFSNTLRVHRDANLGDPASGLLIAGGTLVSLDDLVLNRHVALGEAGASFDSNGYDIRLNGLINGPGGLTKLGEGVLYLAGEHGYAGATVVEAGGLVVDGAFAGDVRVLDGAWFQARGRVGGDLTVTAGAAVSAGNSPGLLEVAGDFVARGEVLVEIASPDEHDFIRVGGVADLTGATLRFTLLDGATADGLAGLSFLQAAGGIAGLDQARIVFDTGLEGFRVAPDAHTLSLAPVPEPETWALLLAGLGLVGCTAAWRRRAV